MEALRLGQRVPHSHVVFSATLGWNSTTLRIEGPCQRLKTEHRRQTTVPLLIQLPNSRYRRISATQLRSTSETPMKLRAPEPYPPPVKEPPPDGPENPDIP